MDGGFLLDAPAPDSMHIATSAQYSVILKGDPPQYTGHKDGGSIMGSLYLEPSPLSPPPSLMLLLLAALTLPGG